jgi:hypothetical protein
MQRPAVRPASEEAHQRLRELAAGDGEDGASPPAGARQAALASGAALHRALELFTPGDDLEAELGRRRRELPTYLAAALEPGSKAWPAALERSLRLWDGFAAGPLARRLAALGDRVIARELPVLLPPGAMAGEAPPVGYVSGFVDLVYRRREDGQPVVVDYKTDEVTAGEDAGEDGDLTRRARAYAPQGAVYARAVRDALGLATDPPFELWFLAAGRVVRQEKDKEKDPEREKEQVEEEEGLPSRGQRTAGPPGGEAERLPRAGSEGGGEVAPEAGAVGPGHAPEPAGTPQPVPPRPPSPAARSEQRAGSSPRPGATPPVQLDLFPEPEAALPATPHRSEPAPDGSPDEPPDLGPGSRLPAEPYPAPEEDP